MAKNKKMHELHDAQLRRSVAESVLRRAFFANIDSRRRQEVSEGGMINEDHRAMANLPERAIHAEYPKSLRRNGLGFPDAREFMRGREAIDDDYEME